MAGQGNPSNGMSDNSQMENLGPLENSTSGDRGSGYFPTPCKNWILAGVRRPRTDICRMKSLNPALGFLLASWSSWAPSCHKSRGNSQSPRRGKSKLRYIGHESRWPAGMRMRARGGEYLDPSPRSRLADIFPGQSFVGEAAASCGTRRGLAIISSRYCAQAHKSVVRCFRRLAA